LIVARILRAALKIIHEMRHDVRRARLSRELKVLAREHVPIKAESQFHSSSNPIRRIIATGLSIQAPSILALRTSDVASRKAGFGGFSMGFIRCCIRRAEKLQTPNSKFPLPRLGAVIRKILK
jgi:hypothetical protein